MSNSIRYSVAIVQFNLSRLIGFDCLFLGRSPLSIPEVLSCREAGRCPEANARAPLDSYLDKLAELDPTLDNWRSGWVIG